MFQIAAPPHRLSPCASLSFLFDGFELLDVFGFIEGWNIEYLTSQTQSSCQSHGQHQTSRNRRVLHDSSHQRYLPQTRNRHN